jgi:hypothetical protein
MFGCSSYLLQSDSNSKPRRRGFPRWSSKGFQGAPSLRFLQGWGF